MYHRHNPRWFGINTCTLSRFLTCHKLCWALFSKQTTLGSLRETERKDKIVSLLLQSGLPWKPLQCHPVPAQDKQQTPPCSLQEHLQITGMSHWKPASIPSPAQGTQSRDSSIPIPLQDGAQAAPPCPDPALVPAGSWMEGRVAFGEMGKGCDVERERNLDCRGRNLCKKQPNLSCGGCYGNPPS